MVNTGSKQKNLIFVGILKVAEEKSRTRIRIGNAFPDPYQITDPEHCFFPS